MNAVYKYVAYDKSGAKVQGQLTAKDEPAVKKELKSQNLIPVQIQKSGTSSSLSLPGTRRKKVTLKELEFITSELALLLKSGVKIDKGLVLLAKGATGPLKLLLDDLAENIKAGKGVAASFSAHSNTFDALYINMLQLGEASGELEAVFSKLASDLKFRRELQKKIVQSLTYPAVILLVCIGCILFVFNYIVPQMAGLFENTPELPFYTEVLLNVSAWFRDYQLYLGVFLLLVAVGLYRAYQNDATRQKLDDWLLRLPLTGKAVLLVEQIRFNASMAMMLSSGVSLVDALKLSTGSLGNQQIARMAETATHSVKQGTSVTKAFANTPLYSDFNLSLLEVGEESGELAPVFDEIADRLRSEFESWVQTLTSMIEPIMILVMGGVVGSVVVVMLMSIVSTNDIGL